MGFRINTNIAAMGAHNNGVMNNRNLDESLSKLSSGLRINKAADDASGMVIANSLRNQANSLGQAIANGNDAIGLVQTADGALNEYAKILDTIKTKSVQAASDGQNTASRQAIQKDINRLMEELGTIAKTTSFNGQKLLSGTFVNKQFQMGANANETVKSSIASAEPSQIGQTSRAKLEITQMGDNQLTLKSGSTGKSLTLEPITLIANNNPDNGMGAVADQINRYSGETGITAKAIVEVTTQSAINAGITGVDFSINGVNIGAINVLANDSQGTLMNAINSKTTESGVSATKTEDGKITLKSNDGRAINVTGDIASVMGSTNDQLSTIGYLEVVQAGSSTFQISGANLASAAGANIIITGSMITIQDSTLAIGSKIMSGSKIAADSTLGVVITSTVNTMVTATREGKMTVGSVLANGTLLNKDTVLGSQITVSGGIVALSSDMYVKAGSTLGSGTVFDAGTTLKQDITVAGALYKAGTVLAVDLTILTGTITLANDMTIHVDMNAANSIIGTGSVLLAGTVLGGDITTTGASTLSTDMIFKAGSLLASNSQIGVGSIFGDVVNVSGANLTTTSVTTLKAGTTLLSASTLQEGSTIGGGLTVNASTTLNETMLIKAGSMLASGTTLKAGTVLTQDLTNAQVGGGPDGLKAGTILGTDVVTTADIYINKDITLAKDSILKANSTLAPNSGNQNSVNMSDEEFTNLSSVDVTTLAGAMKAIDTVNAAITNLDTIRSDLGSVQNQIVATINNISVTQVNVKAAESQLRDVDFAAESANFSKYNILAQSGSYAMSQANAVQQNVLKLLQ
jgi:flagellin